MIKLLPCPFCGGNAEIEQEGTGRQSCIVRCTNCGCSLESSESFNSGSSWNTRVLLQKTIKSSSPKKSKKPKTSKQMCEGCGAADPSFAPCPYASDINGDDTPVWLCHECRKNRAADV